MSALVCFCPFKFVSVHFCQLLSVSVCFCPFLSVSVRFCPFLSVSDCFCTFLSVFVGFQPFLSVSIRYCKFPSVSVFLNRLILSLTHFLVVGPKFGLGIFWKLHRPLFKIECKSGRHSVTKKFWTVLQILAWKPKL